MRKIPLFLALLLALSFPLTALAAGMPAVDASERIHDFTEALSVDEQAALSTLAEEYAAETGMDLVMVVTGDALGKSPRQYAEAFYMDNGFGVGEEFDGLILYINLEDRDWYIATCGGAIRYFYDSDVDALSEVVVAALQNPGEGSIPYSGGRAFLDAARAHILSMRAREDSGSAGSAPDTPLRQTSEEPSNYYVYDIPLREQYGTGRILAVALAVGAGIGGIAVGIMALLHSRSLSVPPHAEQYLESQGMQVTRRTDRFLHTRTARTPIPKNNSHGGGGGGGSSHSSGGHSFGGRGGKF